MSNKFVVSKKTVWHSCPPRPFLCSLRACIACIILRLHESNNCVLYVEPWLCSAYRKLSV